MPLGAKPVLQMPTRNPRTAFVLPHIDKTVTRLTKDLPPSILSGEGLRLALVPPNMCDLFSDDGA